MLPGDPASSGQLQPCVLQGVRNRSLRQGIVTIKCSTLNLSVIACRTQGIAFLKLRLWRLAAHGCKTCGLAAALLGCATPDSGTSFSTDPSDRGLSDDDIRTVETAVRPMLKDPAHGPSAASPPPEATTATNLFVAGSITSGPMARWPASNPSTARCSPANLSSAPWPTIKPVPLRFLPNANHTTCGCDRASPTRGQASPSS